MLVGNILLLIYCVRNKKQYTLQNRICSTTVAVWRTGVMSCRVPTRTTLLNTQNRFLPRLWLGNVHRAVARV